VEEKVIHKFVGSAVKVLGSELGCSVAVGQPSVQGDYYVTRGVTALLGVTGQLRGMVIFGMTLEIALGLVSKMMGEEYGEMDEVAQSGIAELGNVVVGSAVTALAEMGLQCGITPPAVVIGKDTVICTPNIRRIVVPLKTAAGEIEMQLALRDNVGH
jgi:chemotaxis protein CheX